MAAGRGVFVSAIGLIGAIGSLLFPVQGQAGGYDTGGRDWDFLFQTKTVSFEAGARYLRPQRSLKDISGTLGPSADAPEAEAFFVPQLSLAVSLGEKAGCMASYREPWAGHANYGTSWTYAPSAVEQHFSSEDYGLTCRIGMSLWRGNLHLIGGVSHQSVEYELTQAFGPGFQPRTIVGDTGIGWRAGLAFEIPEYALRTSIIYNSAIDYSMTGTFGIPGAQVPIFGSLTMPQSVEWRAQSGVAQDWLAFASVKWTDWSVVGNMPLCPAGVPVCSMPAAVSALTLLWKDSWTFTLGAAHRLNDTVSVTASLTFDQGASQGFTSQTDTWLLGTKLVAQPNEHVELQLGGGLGLMTGGTLSTLLLPGGIPNPFGFTASFDDDLLLDLSASAKIRF